MTPKKKITRREAIKILGTATGASLLANIPSKWSKPEISGGILPAHAQASQSLPTVSTVSIVAVGTTGTATFDGNVTDEGPSPVTAKGFVWSANPNPTLADNIVPFGAGGLGAYQVANVDTTDNILLYGRAYATNTQGTTYGNQIIFQTGTLPTVLTVSIVPVGSTGTATFDGNVTNEGPSPVTARGFVWSTVTNPTLANNVVTFGSGGLGAYQVANVDTTDGILLYGRAYATSLQGTAYGNQITFQTGTLPTVSTVSIVAVGTTGTATFDGNVTNEGSASVTARGFVWSTATNPILADNVVPFGSGGLGTYQVANVNTTDGVLLYGRAYATSSQGTAYGNEITFQTDTLPTVSTDSIVADGNNLPRATFTGTVTDEGSSPVTVRGFVWAESPNNAPTLADYVVAPTTGGSTGSGSFVYSGDAYTGFTPSVKFGRAYATNSAGTAYGIVIGFTTGLCLVEGTLITMADGTTKKIEDINYSDLISVWNFDEGHFDAAYPLWIKRAEVAHQYNLLEFSDGSSLKTINQHRIFNKEMGAFTYPMTEDTPIGTTTFNVKGEEVILVRKTVVHEQVNYYNVITDTHINLFADGILTSCRYNNIYLIVDMKFVKDEREPVPQSEFGVEDKYYEGLRLAEQDIPTEDTIAYINRLKALEVEVDLVPA